MNYNIGDIVSTDKIIDIYNGRTKQGISRTFLKLKCIDCESERDVELAKFNYGNARKCECKTGKKNSKSKLTLGTDTYIRDASNEEIENYYRKYESSKRPLIIIKCNLCNKERITERYKFFGKNGNTADKCDCYVKSKSSLIYLQEKEMRELIGGTDDDNNITILDIIIDDKGHRLYKVKCTLCNRERLINAFDYKYRSVISNRCECDNKYNPYAKYSNDELKEKVYNKYKESIGKKLGLLTVTDIIVKDGGTYFRCNCKCGNKIDVGVSTFNTKRIVSCGCNSKSFGELTIDNLLSSLNLNFKYQYTFEDLKSPRGYKLRFDFAIIKDNKTVLVEFDGKQHIERGHFQENEKYNLEYTQLCDSIKNAYCIENNIKLLRIAYTTDAKEIRDKLLKFLYQENML